MKCNIEEEDDPCWSCEHDERNGGDCCWWEDDGDGGCKNWEPI